MRLNENFILLADRLDHCSFVLKTDCNERIDLCTAIKPLILIPAQHVASNRRMFVTD